MTPFPQASFQDQVSKSQVEESLKRILSDSSYGDVSPTSTEAEQRIFSTIDKIFNWIADLFDFGGATGGGSWLVVILIFVVLTCLVVYAFKVYHRDSQYRFEDGPVTDLSPSAQLERFLQEAMAKALEEGSLTEALSLRFRIGLLAMAKRHPGRLRPGFTNRECLAAWAKSPTYRDRLAKVIDLLDRKWYAREECSMEEYSGAETVLAEMDVNAV